ncbi:MAG: CsbD family protein [Defluviicoccus sp.]
MNWDRVEGKWKQMVGEVRLRWGKLTDDDIEQIQGNRDKLVGRVQERYGIEKDEAERQINDWSGRA